MTASGDKLYDMDWVVANQRRPRRARFFVWWQVAAILTVVAIVHMLDR